MTDPTSSSLWRVELHCHTLFSPDSLTKPQAIINACRKMGIDRIAITEHNTIAGALAVRSLAPEMVIVGEEIMTTRGEILAWFLTEEVPKGLSPEEAIRRLRGQGAVISLSHPLDPSRGRSAMGLEATLSIIEQVDALEVFNARCLHAGPNDSARQLAEDYGKLMHAGSDAHTAREVGAAVTLMPPFHDADSFRQGLAQAKIEAHLSGGHVRFFSRYASLVKRGGKRQGDKVASGR